MSTLSQFKKKYNAELLLTALSEYKVGYKAEWQNLWHTKVEINNYYVSDKLYLSEEKEIELEKIFEEIALSNPEEASIVNVEFEGNREINFALNIPSYDLNLSNQLNTSKILNFSYEGVKARTLNNKASSLLIKELQKIKDDDKRTWRKINDLWFIETLYYATNVKLITDTSYAEELEVKLQQPNINVGLDIKGDNKTTITITGKPNVPFACKIEKIADFRR